MGLNLKELEDEILPVLILNFPRAFFARGKSCRPLRCGVYDDLDGALPPEVDRKKLRSYLAAYTRFNRYLRELVPGATRIGLNGEPAGVVSEQEAAQAREALERRLSQQPVKPVKQQPAEPPKPSETVETVNWLNAPVMNALIALQAEPAPIEIDAVPEPAPEPPKAAAEPDAAINGASEEAKKIASANLADALAAKKAAVAKRNA
jgi:ProP effector